MSGRTHPAALFAHRSDRQFVLIHASSIRPSLDIVLSAPAIHHAIRPLDGGRCEICDTVGTLNLHPIPTDPATIAANLATIRGQIAAAALAAGRDPADVELIAVSKTHGSDAVTAALAAGQRHFGENYLGEALGKITDIDDDRAIWHFIGAIQSNKTRALARSFDWVHTIDREKIARRLDEQCPAGKRLNVCLQVNIDDDPNKSGVPPSATGKLLDACAGLANLQVRGLMTILDPHSNPLASYARLKDLFESLRPQAPPGWDTLSMGMSGDFAAAIAAGATHVRIGTAIFGPRPKTAASVGR